MLINVSKELTTGDKYVRVFYNVLGYKIVFMDLESNLRKATGQELKERMQMQLKDARNLIGSTLYIEKLRV